MSISSKGGVIKRNRAEFFPEGMFVVLSFETTVSDKVCGQTAPACFRQEYKDEVNELDEDM